MGGDHLHLDHVSVRFGAITAVDDVTLTIRRGEVVGLVGASGAGKSTLLRTINLLERPQAGRIRIDDADIVDLRGPALRQLRQGIGMVFQRFNLFARRSAADNIAFPLRVAGVPRAERQRRVAELLELVGLGGRADARPRQLSGGQQQRVGIARALATHPAILLCDEPTSALDPETAGSIITLLRDLNRRLGLTLVVVSHAMDAVKDLCDRVAVMDHGRIVESKPTIELFAAPEHPATRALLRREAGLDLPQPAQGAGIRLRVAIHGAADATALLSATARRFAIDLIFDHGRIGHVAGETLAQVLVRLPADAPVSAVIEHLRTGGAQVEVDDGR
ncbi:methionine import ATP-binding protein MetN 2 [Planctomycetota bacterium]|nr:methionine import ATP-binding protein MetN 2 [Planctomycetota bacterium]